MLLKSNANLKSATGVFLLSIYLLSSSISQYKKIVPAIIIIFIICWIVFYIRNCKRIKSTFTITSIVSIGLYGLYAASLLYSLDSTAGLFDLEVKLSLLIFPLLFSLSAFSFFTSNRINLILMFFVFGTWLSTMICFGIALYRCFTIFFTDDFFMYTYLAAFHHPTYLAIFICMSVAILVNKLVAEWKILKMPFKIVMLGLVTYFFAFVFLLNSKAGILILFLVMLGIIVFYTIQQRKVILLLSLAFILLLFSFLVVRFVPFVNQRFVEMGYSLSNLKHISPDTENNSEQRLLIWNYSSEIISENFLFGVGAGDVKPELQKKYQSHGFVQGIHKNLNAHNQFLQTFMAIGIFGFLVLIFLLFLLFYFAVKKQNVILLSFAIIVAVNMLFESILEVQAGTIFFGFFLAILGSQNQEKDEHGTF